MKKAICIVIAIIFVCAPVMANDLQKCDEIGELAGIIMQKRQANVSMSKIVNVFKDNQAWIEVVIMAYDKPRYRTEKYKQNAIDDFRNKVYLDCVKHITD